MTRAEAKRLKVGDRLTWRDAYSPKVKEPAEIGGAIVERGYGAFKVRWDDGLEVAYPTTKAYENFHLTR